MFLIEQREEFLEKGKASKMALTRSINEAEKDLKNINNLIEEKFIDQRTIIGECQAMLDKQIADTKEILRKRKVEQITLQKDREEHEAWKKQEEKVSIELRNKLIKADSNIRERRGINEEKSVELKKRDDNLKTAFDDLERWRDELISKTDDLDKKTTGLIDRERKLETETIFLKNKVNDFKKAVEEVKENHFLNLRRAGALDVKERELKKLEEDLCKVPIGIEKDKEKVNELRHNSMILGKKNENEKDRLDKLAVELHNREHKLAENEKLFKDKIGGLT